MSQSVEAGVPINLSASGSVSLASGSILGFYVNSTSSGTIVLRNGGASGDVITGTVTPAIGFHRFPAYCTGGCYATIANTLDVTIFYAAG